MVGWGQLKYSYPRFAKKGKSLASIKMIKSSNLGILLIDLGKQCRSRSDCSYLFRILAVCHCLTFVFSWYKLIIIMLKFAESEC